MENASFGQWLKHWRRQRQFSQLDLALAGEVSQRHLSFLESGRSQPSRTMALKLATILEVPLRDQNVMLQLAGFAPEYSENDLQAPELQPVQQALDYILQQQEPFPALVMDRHWNLYRPNQSAQRLLEDYVDLPALQAALGHPPEFNLMRLMFHPQGLRPWVANWEDVAGHLLQRLHREAIAAGDQSPAALLLQTLLQDPAIRANWHQPNWSDHPVPLLTLQLVKGDRQLRFFSTITTLGTPYDITLQELRIECLFPANQETRLAMGG